MTSTQSKTDEPIDDDGMRGFVGYNIKRAYIVVQGAVQSALAKYELRVLSFTGLSIIADNPGITASQLADLLRMERSNLVALIDELETRSLVTRSRLESDRRRFALAVTQQGRKLRAAAAGEIAAAEGRLLAALDAAEQALLIRLLNSVEAGKEQPSNNAAGAKPPARITGRKT